MTQTQIFETTVSPQARAATRDALYLTHYRIALVQESSGTYPGTPPIVNTPADAASIVRTVARAQEEPQEIFGIIAVNTKYRVLAVQKISVGHLHSSLVHPRETFRAAIMHNAAAIVLYHNHPSGDLTPSTADITTTESLVKAGKLIGIDILDHIITGPEADYLSFKEQGLL